MSSDHEWKHSWASIVGINSQFPYRSTPHELRAITAKLLGLKFLLEISRIVAPVGRESEDA